METDLNPNEEEARNAALVAAYEETEGECSEYAQPGWYGAY